MTCCTLLVTSKSQAYSDSRGKEKYSTSSGKSVKIIYRHVFKPPHWDTLLNYLPFFSLTAESREGDLQST